MEGGKGGGERLAGGSLPLLQCQVQADSGVQFGHQLFRNLPQALADSADGNAGDEFRLGFAVQMYLISA